MAMDASTAIFRPWRDERGTSRIQSGASSDRSFARPLIPMVLIMSGFVWRVWDAATEVFGVQLLLHKSYCGGEVLILSLWLVRLAPLFLSIEWFQSPESWCTSLWPAIETLVQE